MVLRHEMGHNFANVGEEYDGGQIYSGANSTSSLATAPAPFKWAKWLSVPPASGHPVPAEQSTLLLQTFPWHNLDAEGPLEFTATPRAPSAAASSTLRRRGSPPRAQWSWRWTAWT